MIEQDDLAECIGCGQNKPVCCDSGFKEVCEPGSGNVVYVEHEEAYCKDCCPNPYGVSYPWPTYERTDCDQ